MGKRTEIILHACTAENPRYASAHEAIMANADLLLTLIERGGELRRARAEEHLTKSKTGHKSGQLKLEEKT